MKKVLPLVIAVLFSAPLIAGEGMHKGDPHKGMGGCASKDKVAKWKELHGQDAFHQTPKSKEEIKALHQAVEQPRKLNLDRFI
ncbi:MAG: hypothetical protein OEZ47_14865 [Gammaproteobacteria bacterium]|nr:hypothetical protein [Gammaproteobacteria bacterium]